MKVRALCIILSIMVVFTMIVAGCKTTETTAAATTAAAGEEITVGYSVMRMVDEYFGNQTQGMIDAIEDSGREISLELADGNNDAQLILQNAMSLLGKGVKVLMVSTTDAKTGAPMLEKAKELGVPLIASDIPIEGAYFLAHDDVQAGYIVGDFAAKYMQSNANFKDRPQIFAFINHAAAADPCDKRIVGFKDAFTKVFPNTKLLNTMDANGLTETASNIFNDIITANPDITGVFCINDAMALGCVAAIEARGLQGKIAVFGQGGCGLSTFNKIAENGTPFIATTSYDPYAMGYDGIAKMVIPLLDGKTIDQRLNGSLSVVSSDNVASWIEKFSEKGQK